MNRVHWFLVLLALCLVALLSLNAVSPRSSVAAAGAMDSSALEKELRDADLEFAKQTAARRLEGWMDFFADNASIIHDGATVTGKQALRAFYQPVFADKDFNLSWTPTHAEAANDGTLGYTYGDYEAKTASGVSHGIYATVWRREGGRWKVVLDMGSATRPQPPAARPQN